jgi:hypothetical protein
VEATPPSNLIFENRDVTQSWRRPRLFGILFIVLFLFFCSAKLTLLLQRSARVVEDKYGSEVQCDEINRLFSSHD